MVRLDTNLTLEVDKGLSCSCYKNPLGMEIMLKSNLEFYDLSESITSINIDHKKRERAREGVL